MFGFRVPAGGFSFQRCLILLIYVEYQLKAVIKDVYGQDLRSILSSENFQPTIEDNSNLPNLRQFLEPCEILTLQTQCTEEEYESNEDCLPQKSDNCDHSNELFCLSGVCLPNCHPHKETYDPIQGQCYRKVGSDCRSVINASTTSVLTRETSSEEPIISSHSSSKSNQDRPLSTVIVPPCEKNAVCERGQCRCDKDFTYDHTFNKCLLYARFAGYCNETVNCDRKSDIECRENECQCKSPETQYFHLKRKRCYILIDQVCSSGLQFCPDNSNCVRAKEEDNDDKGSDSILLSTTSNKIFMKGHNTREDYRLRQLLEELPLNHKQYEGEEGEEHFIGILGEDEASNFVCKCDKEYGSTRDKRLCLGLHETWCNTLHRCNFERGLKCYDGSCKCERERVNEQVFSEQFQTCITVVGAPCLVDGKGEREEDICPIGASCKNGKCVCNDGLIPSALPKQTTSSVAFSCMKSHGMECKAGNLGLDPFEPLCNHEIGLECNAEDEKCLCKNSNQFFDYAEGRCKSFWENRAKMAVPHSPSPPDDREYKFSTNAGTNFCQRWQNTFVLVYTASLIFITFS